MRAGYFAVVGGQIGRTNERKMQSQCGQISMPSLAPGNFDGKPKNQMGPRCLPLTDISSRAKEKNKVAACYVRKFGKKKRP